MKILIVSEDAESRNRVTVAFKQETEKIEFIEVQSSLQAVKLAKRHEPDFLFLDMDLSDGTGLETAELLWQLKIETKLILMGKEARYAIDAFRLRAFYYLLKPFAQDDLAFLMQLMGKEYKKRCYTSLRKLAIECHEGISYIFPHDIVYVSKNKENKTVSIYTKETSYTSTYTLMELEKKLAFYHFIRVHKSYLVNLLYVKELKPYYNSTYNLYLEPYMDRPIPVSRNYVKHLRHSLEL
ncbi:MAG: LytR/AlgR family response regulator transcription factor [Ectobacillus sp.]